MRNQKSGISKAFLLLSLFIGIFIVACQGPLEPHGTEPPAGMGSFTLNIGGEAYARTIMPDVTADDINHFRLIFICTESAKEIRPLLAYDNLTDPVILPVGTYTLEVYGYINLADGPIAWGEYLNPTTNDVINITPGAQLIGSVTLTQFGAIAEGTGIFSWNITLPGNLSKAEMEIIPFYSGRPALSRDLLVEANREGQIDDLYTGFYRVVLTLEKANRRPVIWRRVLHVHKNLESRFTETFTAEHFLRAAFTVTFDYNHLGRYSELTVFYNEINHVPTGLNARSANQFTFRGWYRNPDCANNRGAAGCSCGQGCMLGSGSEVAEGETLYAGWRIAGEWDFSDEDGFSTASLVEPVGDDLEYGWWVRGSVSGTWRSGRVQPLGGQGGTLPMPPLALGFNFGGSNSTMVEDGVTITILGLGTGAHTSAWQRLPPELGGAPIGTAQTAGAEWRITRTSATSNADFNAVRDGVNRMFPQVPDTVARAATVQTAVRNLIRSAIEFSIESEGENEDRVEFVVVEAGFDFDALRAVPNILPHAAGEISAMDDVLAGYLTTELTRLRGLSLSQNEEQIDDALHEYAQIFINNSITVGATQVERVWWNVPTAGTAFTAFRNEWGGHYGFGTSGNPAAGPNMTVEFRNIPATIEIARWRVSVEWHFPTAAFAGANDNRLLAFNNRIPYIVEFITSDTNFRTTPATPLSQGWRTTSLASANNAIVTTPAIRVSSGQTSIGGTNPAPTRRVRLELDVPITHIIVPGETSPAFDPVLFQAIGGGIYWRAPVTANPRTTLDHTITRFKTFNAGANNAIGSIQYSTVEIGHQTYLNVDGQRPDYHTWVRSTCANCDCPHIMGGFDEYNILPPITGYIVSGGIVVGTYTISIPEAYSKYYVELADDGTGFTRVDARIDFVLDADIHQLVTNMTVNGNPVQGSGQNRHFVFEGTTTRHHYLDIRITF